MSNNTAVLILAAGMGTRMKSDLVKVLHPLLGQPILSHVVNSARYLPPERLVIVIGHQADKVKAAVGGDDITFVLQTEQLGTGHAVQTAGDAFTGFEGTVLILSGDVPLLSPQTMLDFLEAHRQSRAAMSVLTVDLPYPGAYGRIIRDENGYLDRIVEARDCSPEELYVSEINSGIYAIRSDLLFQAVERLTPENKQKEYYLTDVVGDLRQRNEIVAAIMGPDPEEVMGINDRVELADAVGYLREKVNHAWMMAGVTMIDPHSNYVETTVKIGRDATLWPGALISGKSIIGRDVTIGPGCHLNDAVIGDGASIGAGSVIDGVEVPAGDRIGPNSILLKDNRNAGD